MTPTGRVTLLLGVLIVAAGLITGYPTLVAMGAALVAAVAAAVAIVGRPPELVGTRTVLPDRVTAGDTVISNISITNNGRRVSSAAHGYERVGDRRVGLDIPTLDPGETAHLTMPLSATKRGIYPIGPLTVRRGDPIGLARRGDVNSAVDSLTVYPYVHDVAPFPAGRRRDLEGLPSGEAAEGGVTFANLHEYVPGDDLRLVHWRSSARLGHLMIRHNIDVHRPRTAVILDTSERLYDEESFEDAVRAAASIIVSAMSRRYPFTFRTSAGDTVNERSAKVTVMDLFASLTPTDEKTHDLGQAAHAASHDPGGVSCAAITGRAGIETLGQLGPVRRRFERLTLVRIGSGQAAEIHELAGAILINARSSADFAGAWNQRMRL